MKRNAVILLSGGIDSTTTLAIAKSSGYDCHALTFDYSQRHAVELESSRKVAASLGVKKHLEIRFDLREIGGSALTSDIQVPKEGGEICGISASEIPPTYVPARNTIFLSFALGWAEVLEAQDIFIGANVIDYSGYPDCRPEYLRAFEEMANLATRASVEGALSFKINAPLIQMAKEDIIRTGVKLGIDYSLTWSCYDPQPEGSLFIPCGKCDSCLIRARGFAEAGIPDPLSPGS